MHIVKVLLPCFHVKTLKYVAVVSLAHSSHVCASAILFLPVIIIPWSAVKQFHSLCQSEFPTECDLDIPLALFLKVVQ